MMEVKPLDRLDATVKLPGSKSYTQRALVIAALAEGESRLRNTLVADDIPHNGHALEQRHAAMEQRSKEQP